MVEQAVQLPDGSSQRVLVPQVYVRVKAGDLDGNGSLLAGNRVALQTAGDLSNSDTIAGREIAAITANNVNNSGLIRAGIIDIATLTDFNNTGGTLLAGNDMAVRGSNVAGEKDVRLANAQSGTPGASDNTVGISLSYGCQSSTSTQHSEQIAARGGSLTAGDNVKITANGSGVKGSDGAILLQGTTVQAGKNVDLTANRDISWSPHRTPRRRPAATRAAAAASGSVSASAPADLVSASPPA